MDTIFLFGNWPGLAMAELRAVCSRLKLPAPEVLAEGAAVVRSPREMPAEVFGLLGGATRQANILAVFELDSKASLVTKVAEAAADRLSELRGEGKLAAGFSLAGAGISSGQLMNIAKATKRELKKVDVGRASLRFVLPESGKELSAATILKHDLLGDSGREFLLIGGRRQVWLAETVAIQDIEAWGRRDVGKPGRDAKEGMLPPKLARMMVNMALPNSFNHHAPKLLDPFCGTGTVLMEAALVGAQAVGIDANSAQVEKARKNADWLINDRHPEALPFGKGEGSRTNGVANSNGILRRFAPLNDDSIKVFLGDAREVGKTEAARQGKFQAVVAEGDLGPALHRPLPRQEEQILARRMADELYKPFFHSLPSVLEPGGHVVIALPRWQYSGVSTHLLDEITRFGYVVCEEFSYGRKGQFVIRDILHLVWQGKRIRPV